MTRVQQLRKIHDLLQQRRSGMVESITATQDELKALKAQERDPEFEEAAQSELADFTLSKLVDNQRTEIQAIDAALARIEAGTFGTCVDCGMDISIQRLTALPFAVRCEEDASIHEQERRGGNYTSPTL
ncbi:MAG TPA: TraR/DksA C4-type zinc finger protein [Myxococcaceae bacterium]|nr:TraR/DksA C4-type zinc finger protein [Myxococcaceae bacterium]